MTYTIYLQLEDPDHDGRTPRLITALYDGDNLPEARREYGHALDALRKAGLTTNELDGCDHEEPTE